MTNKQILLDHKATFNNSERYKVIGLMDAARKDEVIRFGNFLKKFASIEGVKREVLWWDKIVGGRHYTTEQLYELFKKENNEVDKSKP